LNAVLYSKPISSSRFVHSVIKSWRLIPWLNELDDDDDDDDDDGMTCKCGANLTIRHVFH